MEKEISNSDIEKRGVALTSVMAAILLTGTKLVVGLFSGSIGILSEAAHSGLDLIAAMMTFLSVRVSGRKADREHPYGHGKIENLSALFETVLLLITCGWIIYEAGNRLLGSKHVHVEASIWTFLVIILSICVDIGRSRALMRAARKHNSQALEADALHFSTDIWSSCVVLFGLVCVWSSGRLGMPWLEKADSIAALSVALIVLGVCFKLGRRSVDALIDTAPPDLVETIRSAIIGNHDVIKMKRIRVRSSGPEIFTDITVTVAQDMDIRKGHHVAEEIETILKKEITNLDIMVHVEPETMSE
jgi:cation diffusion facilitator family transporter